MPLACLQNIITAPVPIPEPASDWLFNDASGNAVDRKAVGDLQKNGTWTYNGTSISIDQSSTNWFEAANSTYYNLNSFSVCLWFNTIGSLGSSRSLLAIGGGAGVTASLYSMNWFSDAVSSQHLSMRFSDGTTSDTLTSPNIAMANGGDYFAVCNYRRIGAGTCQGEQWFTSDGITWDYTSNTAFRLMQQVNTFEFRSDATTGVGVNMKYKRCSIWSEQWLTQAQVKRLYQLGPER